MSLARNRILLFALVTLMIGNMALAMTNNSVITQTTESHENERIGMSGGGGGGDPPVLTINNYENPDTDGNYELEWSYAGYSTDVIENDVIIATYTNGTTTHSITGKEEGTYEYYVAVDVGGGVDPRISNVETVNVEATNIPPTISMIFPTDADSTINKNDQFTIEADISDPNDNLVRATLSLWNFGSLVDQDTQYSADGSDFTYSYALDTSSPAYYEFRLEAWDAETNYMHPTVFTVEVLPDPIDITITQPTEGEIFSSEGTYTAKTSTYGDFPGRTTEMRIVGDGSTLPDWTEMNFDTGVGGGIGGGGPTLSQNYELDFVVPNGLSAEWTIEIRATYTSYPEITTTESVTIIIDTLDYTPPSLAISSPTSPIYEGDVASWIIESKDFESGVAEMIFILYESGIEQDVLTETFESDIVNYEFPVPSVEGTYALYVKSVNGAGLSIGEWSDEVQILPINQFTVIDYDDECGVGSERFGVSLDYTFSIDTLVTLVIEEMDDIDGDGTQYEDYSTTTEILVSAGSGNLELTASILLAEIGTKGSTTVGNHYRWRITAEGFDDIIIDNIGLWHWSTWNSLKNKGDYWECNLRYDPILTTVGNQYFIYAKMMYWDGVDTLTEVTDSTGMMVEASVEVGGSGAQTVEIDKPDTKVLSDTVHTGQVQMAEYGAGYYFFSFISTTDTDGAWENRIGCPPKQL